VRERQVLSTVHSFASDGRASGTDDARLSDAVPCSNDAPQHTGSSTRAQVQSRHSMRPSLVVSDLTLSRRVLLNRATRYCLRPRPGQWILALFMPSSSRTRS